VDEISLNESLVVHVRLKLVAEKMELLGADASGKLARDGPIGGKYIELLPGTRKNGRLSAEKTIPLDAGNDLDDVMATVKVAIERLSAAIAKVDPILDDAHKLTGEAVAMRESVRTSLSATMANVQAMSAQFRQTSETARAVVGHVDEDRAKIVGDLRGVLQQSDAAVESAKNSLKKVEAELPATLDKAKALLDNARDASADAKQILHEARGDVPAIVRSGRNAAQDAADITGGLRKTWPISSVVKPAGTSQLPLDSFEGREP
jgi:ABC-type transporter Mla subunit MlaD